MDVFHLQSYSLTYRNVHGAKILGEINLITWNVEPEIIQIGSLGIRWYSLSFILGLILGEKYCFKYLSTYHGFSKKEVEKLSLYVILGTIIGARLGHCLFYEPSEYLSNPLEILYIWKGGLASHGGYLGIFIATFLYSIKINKIPYLKLLDILSAPALMSGGFIRLGNLMNSEIIGSPTDLPWAFIFERIDDIPRHPAQLYEAFGYLTISGILYYLYSKFHQSWKPGKIVGITFILGFSYRFFMEFFKENQVYFENQLFFNMGQLLSIPIILLGIFFIFYKESNPQNKKN